MARVLVLFSSSTSLLPSLPVPTKARHHQLLLLVYSSGLHYHHLRSSSRPSPAIKKRKPFRSTQIPPLYMPRFIIAILELGDVYGRWVWFSEIKRTKD
ncbi:hypothetical protein COCNU_04G001430 [Cocos nucifera]|uniref:Uncharacterized protein n=1 Tax=Cocos nucifera TaxID=13894 RepID=A0A8K0MZQ5_COCNU|nr:hypothetical protein COCNU_04G001430 [Cocos nucifera]